MKVMSRTPIDAGKRNYRKPLEGDAHALAASLEDDAQVILLGSVASGKYVDILWPIFQKRLRFPSAFAGLGDMSRGGLMLRAVRANRELEYTTLDAPGIAPAAMEKSRRAGDTGETAAQSPVVAAAKRLVIPTDATDVVLNVGAREVRLTNLPKLFWKTLKITKRDLLQYYADISPYLLPHLAGRAMVMKRYPNGAEGDFFYMKRAPEPRPEWIDICQIPHDAGMVNFPIVQDLPSLLWLINLGCIDLKPVVRTLR